MIFRIKLSRPSQRCRLIPTGTTSRDTTVNKKCIVKLYRHVRIHSTPPHPSTELSLHLDYNSQTDTSFSLLLLLRNSGA